MDKGESLLGLVTSILDISKIEAARVKLVVSDVGVNAIMRDAVATVTPHARKKGLRVAWQPSKLPAVQCDREKIRQALINLVTNAVKFTPSGGSVTVEAAWCGRSKGINRSLQHNRRYCSVKMV